MVLFKSRRLAAISLIVLYLHSTMVLFKSCQIKVMLNINYIYIPLWSYSNVTLQGICTAIRNLHSTMVLFKSDTSQIAEQLESDLHSTMVLFKSFPYFHIFLHYKNLHSTMVLFKLARVTRPINIPEFTFHYGPIQIGKKQVRGSDLEIYIPLWSYSNEICLAKLS